MLYGDYGLSVCLSMHAILLNRPNTFGRLKVAVRSQLQIYNTRALKLERGIWDYGITGEKIGILRDNTPGGGGALPRILYAGVPFRDLKPHPSIRRVSAKNLTLL